MKILFIGHESELNGASQSMLNIISCLENDHDIYVLTSFCDGAFVHALKERRCTVIHEPFDRWMEKKGRFKSWIRFNIRWILKRRKINKDTAIRVAAYAKEQKIDIIHTNTGVLNIGALISKYSGIKHIWHIREFGDLDFDMHWLFWPFRTRFMAKYTDKFIFVSRAVCEYYSFIPKAKKCVIYNGVGKENILDRENNRNSDIINLLIAGRVSKTKGQYMAIEACNILLSRGIKNFKLHIAGSNMNEIEPYISEDIKDYVKLHGVVKDMPALRQHMDIELVCSKAEAFGRVTAEAMLGGMPVIGSRTGGTPELIEEGKTGFLFEYGNSDDLADKIKRLIQNKELLKEMGENAREYAKSHFMIERCVNEIMGVYRSVAKQ